MTEGHDSKWLSAEGHAQNLDAAHSSFLCALSTPTPALGSSQDGYLFLQGRQEISPLSPMLKQSLM